LRAAALEARGDVQTMAERPAEAMAAYRQVTALDADEDRRRTMEVKALAAGYGPRQGAALRALLIGDPKLGPSWDEAAPLLGAPAPARPPAPRQPARAWRPAAAPASRAGCP